MASVVVIMVQCCVPGCKSISSSGTSVPISFHRFPKSVTDRERYLAWMVKIRRDQGPAFKVNMQLKNTHRSSVGDNRCMGAIFTSFVVVCASDRKYWRLLLLCCTNNSKCNTEWYYLYL